MFKCKACIAKERHISDLRDEILSLRKLVYAPSIKEQPLVMVEADAVLSGREQPIEYAPKDLTPEQLKELEDIESEATRLLSGTY